MEFRLIDKNWARELADGLKSDKTTLRIICPFIKEGALTTFLSGHQIGAIQVITRYSLTDFLQGVSDTKALRILLDRKAEIRGIKNLHAKVFIFGKNRLIVTSANLTSAALSKNHEFGFVSGNTGVIGEANKYFDDLWRRGGTNLDIERIDSWDQKLTIYLAVGGRLSLPKGLRDEGVDVGLDALPTQQLPWAENSRQVFVKFLGQAKNRASLTLSTIDEIHRAGCHWALGYPAAQRPTGVQDGALMFIARLTKDPADIRIFGRAIAMRHVPGRDDATPAEIQDLQWKNNWPRYIRVHHAEFVAGSMSNGISLYEMMSELGSASFSSTWRHAEDGAGNTDPRHAYGRKPAVQLTPQAFEWLNQRLESAFTLHGKVPEADLDEAGWPALPMPETVSGNGAQVSLISDILKREARLGTRAIFYEPIMQKVGLTRKNPADRNRIGKILEQVSELSFKEVACTRFE